MQHRLWKCCLLSSAKALLVKVYNACFQGACRELDGRPCNLGYEVVLMQLIEAMTPQDPKLDRTGQKTERTFYAAFPLCGRRCSNFFLL